MENNADRAVVELKQQLEVLGTQKEILRRDYQAVTGDVGFIGRLKLSSVLTNEQEKFIRAMSEIRLQEMKLIASYQAANFKAIANAHIDSINVKLVDKADESSGELRARSKKRMVDRVRDFEKFIYTTIDEIKADSTYNKDAVRLNSAIDRLEEDLKEGVQEIRSSHKKIIGKLDETDGLDFI